MSKITLVTLTLIAVFVSLSADENPLLAQPIFVSVSTDKNSYRPNEDISVTVTAHNFTVSAVTLHFSSSCQASYTIDYSYRYPVICLTVLTEVTIPLGGSHSWEFIHKPSLYSLAVGNHTIIGEVLGYALSTPTVILISGEDTVPVELVALNATTTASSVIIKWRTATETNNLGFNIYRSDTKNGKYIKVNSKLIQGAGTDATPHDYSLTDDNVKFGETYYYYIEDVDFTGKKGKSPIIKITVGQKSEVKVIDKPNITIHPKLKTDVIPTKFALLQNFPNPFNPETWIPFNLAADAPVTISIYDAKGQIVCTIVLGNKPAGIYATKSKAAYWDGKDSLGEKVSSGVYFYTLQAGEFRATRKMVVVK
jgi:hypothetical protein